jgi:class 3 adenylate cyclase/tetratricopeptide (TPR) repeat protein
MAACPNCGRESPDEARFCPACAAPLPRAPAPLEVRKTVTVLFSDVVDWTPVGERLDPESLRRLMARYFAEMRAAVERHGGTIEKFVGDAVMAVFGVPTLHEDDALRAVRAAVEMRERLAVLNDELTASYGVELAMRIGINTGEVVAGAGADTLVTGHPVTVAKRLEQAASPREILIGKETYRLVRDEVEAGPLESFPVKGKPEQVARRLDELGRPDARETERKTPFAGREVELGLLLAEFELTLAAQGSRLVTVLGAAGIGKSRLARELPERLAGRATALKGRCLPYGDGITFWPLAEMVRQAGGEAGLREALHDHADVDLIVERVLGAIGAAAEAGGGEETFWAVRKLVEAIAGPRPLVLVFEDIHWAESTLLDLIEYLAGWIRDAPVLLLCLARPDLLDRQPSWLTPRQNTRALSLEPLSSEETELLLRGLGDESDLDSRLRERVAEAAEGNPLFAEQMLAMLTEEGEIGERLPMPPSIQSLLAARLDRLGPDERAVIESAAVVGREFWRSAVCDLVPRELRDEVGRHLMALVRKELVSPEASTLEREDAFRFRHVLIRDAAYEGMPKERRAELHEKFAAWSEEHQASLASELEEIVGYHLEQACLLRRELGTADSAGRALASKAGALLGRAGRRALARDDVPAAVNLLTRATVLLRDDDEARIALAPDLGRALAELGEFERADGVLERAVADAQALGRPELRSLAEMERALLHVYTRPDGDLGDLVHVAERAIDVFGASGDDLGLAKAWTLLSQASWWHGRMAEMEEVLEMALAHARSAGSDRAEGVVLNALARTAFIGPRPVPEAIERCEGFLERSRSDRPLRAVVLNMLGMLVAMSGDFDRARELCAESQAVADDLGLPVLGAAMRLTAGAVELLADDAPAAVEELQHGYETLQELGERGRLATIAAMLARALTAAERDAEAAAAADASDAAASDEDLVSQIICRGTRARLTARSGDLDEAERLAREAVALAEATDYLSFHADALADLAEVLRIAERENEARKELEHALELYKAKGNVSSAERVRRAIDVITAHVPLERSS